MNACTNICNYGSHIKFQHLHFILYHVNTIRVVAHLFLCLAHPNYIFSTVHKFHKCELWGFYSDDAVNLSLLGYYADKQGIDSCHSERLEIYKHASQNNDADDTNLPFLQSLLHKGVWRSRRNNTQAATQNHYNKTQGFLPVSSILTTDRDLSETKHGLTFLTTLNVTTTQISPQYIIASLTAVCHH